MNWNYDLTFARVVAEQIDDYVHAEVLFFPVGAMNGMQMPALTIGAWLETAWRLSAAGGQGAPALVEARAAVARVRGRARELYEAKARREFKSRLDSISMWLDELLPRAQPLPAAPTERSGYRAQALLRLKLELLRDEVSQPQNVLLRLRGWDASLRGRFISGPFLLEPELAFCAEPKERYWFLFGGI